MRCLLLYFLFVSSVTAFNPLTRRHERTPLSSTTSLFATTTTTLSTRRNWLRNTTTTTVLVVAAGLLPGRPCQAADVSEATATTTTTTAIETKTFVDPQGYFAITIPANYFAIRRSAKGDLPDAKTGQGRRGSSIFTAGNMAKAEVIAVERFPTRVLLEEVGIDPTGDLSTFPALGDPTAIANLITLRREKDSNKSVKAATTATSIVLPDSIVVSTDKMELSFVVKTEIEVQKPELLLEQYGVSQLFRITSAKASLRSGDGNLMVVFASALEQDYNGPDGMALQNAVDSFTVTNQSDVGRT